MSGELDVARLREVAEAATQAEWVAATENRRKDSTPLLGVASRRGQGAHGCIAVFAGGGDLIRDRNANAEHCATFDPPTVLALLARLEAAESARDEALAAVERVRALADIVRRLQEPDPDSGDRDVSFFALLDALDPDDAALTPSAPTEEER